MVLDGEGLTRNYERREWTIRHIPVRVKGRSPRPYRIPRLWISIMIGVCLYLAVHLNGNRSFQNKRVYLRRAERDLSGNLDYYIPPEQIYPVYPKEWNFNATYGVMNNGMRPIRMANVIQMDHQRPEHP